MKSFVAHKYLSVFHFYHSAFVLARKSKIYISNNNNNNNNSNGSNNKNNNAHASSESFTIAMKWLKIHNLCFCTVRMSIWYLAALVCAVACCFMCTLLLSLSISFSLSLSFALTLRSSLVYCLLFVSVENCRFSKYAFVICVWTPNNFIYTKLIEMLITFVSLLTHILCVCVLFSMKSDFNHISCN